MQMAYVDFAADCLYTFQHQAILSNGDVPYAAAYRERMVRAGSGGIAAVIASRRDRIRAVTPCRCEVYAIKEKGRRPPGRLSVPFAATKGTRNCTILYGNVHFSMQSGSVSRWLPQSLRDSSLPEGASVCFHRLPFIGELSPPGD